MLGVRPADLGFRRVEVAPLLGPLTAVSGALVHPRGRIELTLSVVDGALEGEIVLPPGVTGTLRDGQQMQELMSGRQHIVAETQRIVSSRVP